MENDDKKPQKDPAKTKILLFIIGVLVGAVISTAAFLVYAKTLGVNTSSNNGQSSQQMPGGTPPEKPSGENDQGGMPPQEPTDKGGSNTTDGNQ